MCITKIVTSKYLLTEIEDYVSDIYKAITSFENILEKCKRIMKYRNSNLNPFSAYGNENLGVFLYWLIFVI